MDLFNLDHIALHTKAPFHDSSVIIKMCFVLITVGLLIATTAAMYPIFIFALIVVVMLTNKVPVLKILPLLFYPIFFTGLFTLLAGYPLNYSLWLISKSCTIALSLLLLVSTTPIYKIFSVMQKVLPTFFVDALFFTYRSLFIFQQLFTNLFTVLKLKGGFDNRKILKNTKNMGSLVAITFIRALDSAQNMADVMKIRGYSCGNLKQTAKFNTNVWDLYPGGLTLLVIISFLWV
ncbi:energy-coupling factor transporter transmembrane component T [Proteinivorax hydrogeniformans]|uniref:Energy-coupling factor transporter transmembrane component T n=1 Tax=Proteinivorax hydrogeniformans TaxID=1826727 RepID=A0AAU8HWF6_9FIRM